MTEHITEVIMGMALLTMAVQMLLNAFHRRDIETERMQAFDMGRKSGIEHYRQSWEAAQDDWLRQHQEHREAGEPCEH